jgi:putative peptidoglycan lipid II flippase
MKVRNSIFKNTLQMGFSTMLSKFFGFFREILLVRFLGVGAVADAYNIAFNLPNTLRRIFAEGAMHAALTPTVVSIFRKEGKTKVNELITFTLIITQIVLLFICFLMNFYADKIVWLSAPGFTVSKQMCAISLTKIFIFLVIFVSSSSILASALMALQKFFIPSNGSIFTNLLLISQILICLKFGLSVIEFAYFVVFDFFVLFIIHLIAYFYNGLSFSWPKSTTGTRNNFLKVLRKFVPSMLATGSAEISFMIDRAMASFLPTGSISLFSWTSTIFRIPLGIFASAFATILLPSMSHVAIYAPRRLSFYLHEALKVVAWVAIPLSILMAALSYKLFYTIYLSDNFTVEIVLKASQLLVVFSSVLFFFSINKILINLFYALHDTTKPAVISLLGAFLNTILNFFLMQVFGVFGIALSTSISAIFQTIVLLFALNRWYGVAIYFKKLWSFLIKMLVQMTFFGLLLFIGYFLLHKLILLLPVKFMIFFLAKMGFWFWFGPICFITGLLMYMTRKKFGLRFYFLD